MSREAIIRAWKDEDYWLNLSEAERAAIPDSPIGGIELDDVDLAEVAGAQCSCYDCYSFACTTICTQWSRRPQGCCC